MSTGTGDLHSAAVGSGAVADFDPHLYIGTSSWISCHVPYKKTAATTNVASIPSAIPGRYVIADEHETAGACLTFLKDVFYADDELGALPQSANALKLFDQVARSDAQRGERGDVHALVQRRADPGRRPHDPRRVPQPVACELRDATWSAPSTRGSPTTRDGFSMRWRGSATSSSNPWRSSGEVPTRRSGARSMPT